MDLNNNKELSNIENDIPPQNTFINLNLENDSTNYQQENNHMSINSNSQIYISQND